MRRNSSFKIALGIAALTLISTILGASSCQPSFSASDHNQVKAKPQVILFWDTDCPVAHAYSERIQNLYKRERASADFKLYFPNQGSTDTKIKKYLKDYGVTIPYTIDNGAKQAKKWNVATVPEAIILNSSNQIQYRGAIDDNKIAVNVKNNWLQTALDQTQMGLTPTTRSTNPVGCTITPSQEIAEMTPVTYASHIAKIIDRSCIACHRPGQTAPFSLVGYENAKAKANMINVVTTDRRMPPWKATLGYGEFHDENVLTEAEVSQIAQWVKNGSPLGDSKKLPKPRVFTKGEWSLGTPDLIAAPTKSFKIYANGEDIYRHFVIKTNLTKPVWVKAMDVSPGNRRAVHHVIAFIDNTKKGQKLEAQNTDGQQGYNSFGWPGFAPAGSFGGWAPGLNARKLPEGAAFKLNPGEDIVLQVHYHPTGKPEEDLTKVGFYFAKTAKDKLSKGQKLETITNEVNVSWLLKVPLIIPANDANNVHKRTFPIPVDYKIYSLMPHMHLLGKVMRASVITPEGNTEPLIEIKDWDFNWQMNYALKTPKIVRAGSKIVVEAVYDNSSKNPNNPNNPPKRVTWGEQTTDEMFLFIVTGSPVNPNEKMDIYTF